MRYIKEDVIEDNIKQILLTNDLILVLKDNAYGFGLPLMVKLAKKYQLKRYAVKNVGEGYNLRCLDEEAEILILGKIKKEELKDIIKYNLTPTLNDYDDYILFKENNISCHLAIDTGMNRFGMKSRYLALINDKIVKAIYTHLYSDNNIEKIRFIEDLARKYNKRLHIGGSNAYGKTLFDLRVGKMLYENALSFYGHIVNIKELKKGETVGYDGLFKAPKDCLIGICDIGYVNGLDNLFNGRVWINNNYYFCVGKCCMDHSFIMIDESVKLGDEVEFFGNKISEDEFVIANKTTKYRLFLNINQQNSLK